MSDQSANQPPESEGMRNMREALDRAEKRAAEAEAKANAAIAQSAGIDVTTKAGQAFLRSYEGDWTLDAVRAEALDWKLIAPPASPQEQAAQAQAQAQAAEQQAQQTASVASEHAARSALAGSEPAGLPPDPDIMEQAYADARGQMRQGLPEKDAQALIAATVIGEAMNGNQRFVWNGHSEEDLRRARAHDRGR